MPLQRSGRCSVLSAGRRVWNFDPRGVPSGVGQNGDGREHWRDRRSGRFRRRVFYRRAWGATHGRFRCGRRLVGMWGRSWRRARGCFGGILVNFGGRYPLRRGNAGHLLGRSGRCGGWWRLLFRPDLRRRFLAAGQGRHGHHGSLCRRTAHRRLVCARVACTRTACARIRNLRIRIGQFRGDRSPCGSPVRQGRGGFRFTFDGDVPGRKDFLDGQGIGPRHGQGNRRGNAIWLRADRCWTRMALERSGAFRSMVTRIAGCEVRRHAFADRGGGGFQRPGRRKFWCGPARRDFFLPVRDDFRRHA